MFSTSMVRGNNRVQSLVVLGLAAAVALTIAVGVQQASADPSVSPSKGITLTGFTGDGLMKVGPTDRESGVFPPDVEAYPFSESRFYEIDPAVAEEVSE